MVHLDHTPTNRFSAYIRYKYRERESYQHHQIRYQQLWKIGASLLLRTLLDGVFYQKEKLSTGVMLTQTLSWNPTSKPLSTDLSASLFHTDNYNCRIYSYEKNVPYQYYRPSLFGKGVRMTASCRWQLHRSVQLYMKWAWMHYFEGDTIGTGLEQIDGKDKMDLYAGLSWKF